MSANRQDIIDAAAKEIFDKWRHWDADAKFAVAVEQDGSVYEPMMIEKLKEVINSALQAEDWRCGT